MVVSCSVYSILRQSGGVVLGGGGLHSGSVHVYYIEGALSPERRPLSTVLLFFFGGGGIEIYSFMLCGLSEGGQCMYR